MSIQTYGMDITKEQLTEAVKASNSIRQVARTLGVPTDGFVRQQITTLIKTYDLDISHFGQTTYKTKRRDWREILVKGKVQETKLLRRAMIEFGIEFKCRKCGLPPEWQGEPLVLQIEHRDGDRTNNVPDNVEFLCPNCHTQTKTWGVPKVQSFKNQHGEFVKRLCIKCGKSIGQTATSQCKKCWSIEPWNKGKSKKPENFDELADTMTTQELARMIGVTESHVRKWKRGITR